MQHTSALTSALTLILFTSLASANPEPPAIHDGRSVGMAGAGVAISNNGSATFHNPAVLDTLKNGVVTVGLTGIIPKVDAPVNGPETKLTSPSPFSPIAYFGGALRLHERVVLALGGYATSGLGAKFDDVMTPIGPRRVSNLIGSLELTLPVVVRIMDGLAIAAGPRLVYIRQEVNSVTATDDTGTSFAPFKQKTDGFGLGAQVGIFYQPMKELRFGFSYRSKAKVDLNGDRNVEGMKLDVDSEFAVPHSFRWGAAYAFLDGRLLATAELKYSLYSEANKKIPQTVTVGGTSVNEDVQLHWRNTVSGTFAGEFFITPMFPVRAGYHVGMSATPKEWSNPFVPSPGVVHGFSLGTGVHFPFGLEFDIGALYAICGQHVGAVANPMAATGDYSFANWVISAGATYRK